MNADTPVDWTELAPHLVDAAEQDQAWYLIVARELVAPGDRLAGDVGCGAARQAMLNTLARRVAWLRPTGLVTAADLDTWDHLLDPTDERWLSHRNDRFRLSTRSVHLGVRP